MAIQPVQSGLPAPQASFKLGPADTTPQPPTANTQGGVSPLAVSGTPGTNPAQNATGGNLRPADAQSQADGKENASEEQLSNAIARIEKALEPVVRDISFSVHDKTGDVVVKVVDRESQEVIRQIPSEELLRIAERIEELGSNSTAPGLLLRQEA